MSDHYHHPPNHENHHRRLSSTAASPIIRQRVVGDGSRSSGKNIKALSRAHASAQWKETLRKSCLERVKLARMERLRKSRLLNVSVDNSIASWSAASTNLLPSSEGCCVESDNRLKRGREEELENVDWSGIHDYNYNDDDDDESIIKYTQGTGGFNSDADSEIRNVPTDSQLRSLSLFEICNSQRQEDSIMQEDDDNSENKEEGNAVDMARALVEQELQRASSGVQQCRERFITSLGDYGFDYSLSHEEFLELLNDVTEELQREGAYMFALF